MVSVVTRFLPELRCNELSWCSDCKFFQNFIDLCFSFLNYIYLKIKLDCRKSVIFITFNFTIVSDEKLEQWACSYCKNLIRGFVDQRWFGSSVFVGFKTFKKMFYAFWLHTESKCECILFQYGALTKYLYDSFCENWLLLIFKRGRNNYFNFIECQCNVNVPDIIIVLFHVYVFILFLSRKLILVTLCQSLWRKNFLASCPNIYRLREFGEYIFPKLKRFFWEKRTI